MNKNKWLQYIENLHSMSIDYRIEPVIELYKKLKLPKIARTIITVAGTNGKGTTVGLLEKIYLSAGYKVASYTSPHIIDFNERIKINGKNISDQELINSFELVEKYRENQAISYFSFITLAALYIFSQQNLDVAILEIGMGGKKDAVNVSDNDLSIITSIDLDHTDFLGNTVDLIAEQKAGIIKNNTITIVGARKGQNVIVDIANNQHAKSYVIDKDFTLSDFKYLPKLTMHNDNAAVVCKALEVLKDRLFVTDNTISAVFDNFNIAGRKQILNIDNKKIILDCAHNEEAVEYFAEYINKYLKEYNLSKIFVVFGGLKTKNTNKILELINNKLNVLKYFLVKVESEYSTDFKNINQVLNENKYNVFDKVLDGLNAALLEANQNDIILVFGSFYTIKPVMEKYVS